MWKKIFAAMLTATFILTAFSASEAKSLWRDRSHSIFADKKARNVGDILTIVISESTTQSATKSRSNTKSASVNLDAGVGFFRFLGNAASAGASDSFTADGSANDTNRYTGRITVTVVEVLPNDNMIIEGKQSIWQNRDEHKITLRGIIRRDDVLMDNTVPSYKVADATIRFDGKGPLNAKQRQGILTQIFNFLF